MKVVVANNMAPFVHGGAEELALHLVRRLGERGHEVELLRVPFRWEPYAVLPKQIAIAQELSLDQADTVIALKFPAYLIPHQNKRVWLLHQYRQAYDLYATGYSNIPAGLDGDLVRESIVAADNRAFDSSRRLFTNSPITSARLHTFNGIDSEVLYPPLNDPELFFSQKSQPYIFAGGRVNAMKRQELLIRALAKTPEAVRLVIAGPPDDAHSARVLRDLAAQLNVSHRVTLELRFCERSEIANWVNHAAACAYIPYDEDSLGYVAMEAAQARKAVITLSDSGGVLGLVRDGETGWVAEPEVDSVAEAMTSAISLPREARNRGEAMHARWLSFGANWDQTLDRLVG